MELLCLEMGAALFGVPDNLGSTRVLTNASGQTQSTTSYDPFGVPNGGSGSATSPLGYTGQLTDSSAASGATGFEDLRARMYDPSTGQFLQRDSYAGSMGNAGTLNHYSYAGDTPTVNTDPGGHDYGDVYLYSAIACLTCGGGFSIDLSGLGAGLFGLFISTLDYQLNVPGVTAFQMPDVGQILKFLAISAIVLVTGAVLWPVISAGIGLIGLDGAPALIAGMAVLGAVSGGLQQALTNMSSGQPWDTNLGGSMLEGAAIGVIAGGFLGRLGLFDGLLAGASESTLGGAVDASTDSGLSDLGNGVDRSATDVAPSDTTGVEGGCSFSAGTLVATPSGERPIGSLKVGDDVLAYNPTTGQTDTEPVQHVWINHDHDLVDVGLRETASGVTARTGTASSSSASAKTTTAPSTLRRAVQAMTAAAAIALAVTLGSAVPVSTPPPTTATSAAPTAPVETVHTTANHPWLTADRGWVEAGELKPGEPVVTLSGATEAVAWVHAVSGQADMYNLTVAQDHTYAVGDSHAVVHNIGPACEINDPNSEISQVSMRARMENGIEPGRNVAVYRIGSGESAEYLAAASDGGLHSEEILNSYIDDPANGLSRGDVTGIYSERVPCMSKCMGTMSNYPNAQNDISFSLNPDIGNVRALNAGTIARAMGEYEGTPAWLPGYQWITP